MGLERQEDSVLDKAGKNSIHRRALGGGITASIALHAVALTVLTIPAPDAGAGEGESDRIALEPFDAVELIELPEVVESPVEVPQDVPDELATNEAQGAVAPEMAEASPDVDARLSQMGQVSLTAQVPSTSRPVITFADLEPVANTAAMMATFAFENGLLDENDEGDLEGLLGRLSAELSGGGHCPTPGTAGTGPLILR